MLSIVGFRDMAGYSNQQDLGYELNQTHETEVQRGTGPFIHLPSDCGIQHLQAKDEEEITDEIASVGRKPERSVSVVRL